MNESMIREEKLKKVILEVFETTSQEHETRGDEDQPRNWKALQLKVKEICEKIGCEVEDEVMVDGARTRHRTDVLASFEFGGQKYRIIVECKYWNKKVRKTQVATLLSVLADIGGEKGIIVSKKGYQSGALSLASYTNIELVTFNELKRKLRTHIEEFKIHYAKDKIRSLSNTFMKFYSKMKEETDQKGLWWVPSDHGWDLLGSLSMLRLQLENLDIKKFPRRYYYLYVSPSNGKKPMFKEAHSRIEYLGLVLDNLRVLEREYEEFKEQIFSE